MLVEHLPSRVVRPASGAVGGRRHRTTTPRRRRPPRRRPASPERAATAPGREGAATASHAPLWATTSPPTPRRRDPWPGAASSTPDRWPRRRPAAGGTTTV